MTVTIDGGAGVTFPDGVQQTNGVTNTGGGPPYFAARAWVTFDGTVNPPTILAAANVASVTRSGTGDYTVTFAVAMPSANYAISAIALGTGAQGPLVIVDGNTTPTTNAIRLQVIDFGWPAGSVSAAAMNSSRVSAMVFA